MTAYFSEFFRFDIYKGRQGTVARQATFGALAIVVLFGVWRLSVTLAVSPQAGSSGYLQWLFAYGLPLALAFVGLWAAFRAVNFPAFADFLIGVEAEMSKVSWPSRQELLRSSVVVVIMIVSLSFLLYIYDFIWATLLWSIGL